MNISRLRAGRRLTAAAGLGTSLIGLGTLFLAPPTSAAAPTPWGFSTLVSPNPRVVWVDDCRVEIGIVYDGAPATTGWHHIGGVRVNCRSTHRVISATVALYYRSGGNWLQFRNGTYGARTDSTGSGPGVSGILRTPSYCVGALGATQWTVGATVRTERRGATNYGYAYPGTTSGC